jgi:hypothetical protein
MALAFACAADARDVVSPSCPAQRASNANMDGLFFSFYKWEHGLAIMFVDSVGGGVRATGELAESDYTADVRVKRSDGKGYAWRLVTDGHVGELTINGKSYDLSKGTLFAVKIQGGKAVVHQIKTDLSRLESEIPPCTKFVNSNGDLARFFGRTPRKQEP